MSPPRLGPIATIGAHIVDILARPIDRIPDGQDTVLVEQIRLTAAGSSAGTAVDLVRLGAERVSCHGAVGDDELGDLLLAILARHGVDTSGLARRTGEQTAASILPIRPDGGRPSFHVPGANLGVTPADVAPEAVTGARAVHLGGMDVTFALSDPAFFALLDRARAGGTVVTMDLLSEMADLLVAAKAFLPHVDYVLPNLAQALAMTGAADAEGAAHALLGEGVTGALITMGGEGSLVAVAGPSGPRIEHVPALPVPVVDTTGCGDAYCAGFIVGLLHGHDVRTAARWGTAAAAKTATGLGSDAGITDLGSTLALLAEDERATGTAARDRA